MENAGGIHDVGQLCVCGWAIEACEIEDDKARGMNEGQETLICIQTDNVKQLDRHIHMDETRDKTYRRA